MQKIALAALLLGVFSLSPLAKAEDAPANPDDGLDAAASSFEGGMGLGDLRGIATGFNVRLQGETLYMDGSIPRKCARGASVSLNSEAGADGKPGRHTIRLIPGAECSKLSAADKRDRVKLSSSGIFGASRSLADNSIDGPVCLIHNDNGPDVCDNIPNTVFTSEATKQKKLTEDAIAKQKETDKKAAETAAQERKRKEDELVAKLNLLCKNGDFAGFGAEIEAAKAFLGDVTTVLSKVDGLKKRYYEEQIKKAKDIDAIKDAYDAYLSAASENGWDTDDVNAAYADRRIELMNAVVADGSKSNSDKARTIREMATDLRDLGLMREKQGKLGSAYFTLGSQVRENAGTDMGKLQEAEKYFRDSLQYADADQAVKVEAEIAKMYNQAADQCIEDAKEKGKGFNKCDALAKKAKKSMDLAMKAQKRIKGDDSMEALAGMKQEKLARFGMDGASMSVSGYGTFNRMGGTYDATKYQAYTQSQQKFVMEMMMQRSMGGMGMQPGAGGSGGGYFQ